MCVYTYASSTLTRVALVADATEVKKNAKEHIGHVVRMSTSGNRGKRFVSQQRQYVESLSKKLYSLASVDSAVKLVSGGDTIVKGVQCFCAFLRKLHLKMTLFYTPTRHLPTSFDRDVRVTDWPRDFRINA